VYKIKINSAFSYDIQSDRQDLIVDGKVELIDIHSLNSAISHILKDNKSYRTELITFDPVLRSGTVKINSNVYQFSVTDQYDELLHKLGLDKVKAAKIAELKAPMPGLVLQMLAVEGQEVKKGDNLLILEAMKMENIIKSPADLTIGSVKIKAGDKVEKNQILLIFK